MPDRSLLPAADCVLISTSEALLLGLGTASVPEAERRLLAAGVYSARHFDPHVFSERCWDADGVLAARALCRQTPCPCPADTTTP